MSISSKTIQGFILGNQEAIGEVYDEYKNLMYFVIASYISLPEDCEDVLSESFIKAINSRNNIKDPSNLKTYLTAIAKNQALDFLKKKKEIANSEVIDEMYGETDQYNVMLNMLEPLLTNKETIVTYYKAVFQYSWPEIVELTGIKESTARKLYAEALEKLRKELR